MNAISKAVRKLKVPKDDSPLPQLDKIKYGTGSVDSYLEQDPSVAEWFRDTIPTQHQVLQYLISLFPFSRWIFSYNLQWLAGDVVAGMRSK